MRAFAQPEGAAALGSEDRRSNNLLELIVTVFIVAGFHLRTQKGTSRSEDYVFFANLGLPRDRVGGIVVRALGAEPAARLACTLVVREPVPSSTTANNNERIIWTGAEKVRSRGGASAHTHDEGDT